MPSDYAAILRDPLTIRISGTTFTLPYRPAAVWAKGLETITFLAATLAGEEVREQLVDMAVDNPGILGELRDESLRILKEQSGRTWWEAGRLVSTSVAPEILGRMVLAGVDPWQRSIGEWCAATYALCLKGADEKARLRFDFSLSLPPPGFDDEWDDGVDPEQVAADLAKMTGKR